MFNNNFINNIVRSMMALCVAANGWSDNGGGETLVEQAHLGYAHKENCSTLNENSKQSNPYNEDSSKSKKQKLENVENNESEMAPRNGALQEDRIEMGLIQFNEELKEFFNRIERLSDTDKILLIMGKLDTVCNLFYPKQEFNKKFTNHKSLINEIQSTISTHLNQITAGSGVLTEALKQRYVNIFPSLLRYVVSCGTDMNTYPNLLNAINNSYLEVQGAPELVENSDSKISNAEAVNRLRYIVSVLSNY